MLAASDFRSILQQEQNQFSQRTSGYEIRFLSTTRWTMSW